MKNTSAYLYFYDDRGQYSKILHLTTLCASIAFKHVYLCVSEEYLKTFSNKGLLPENVELYCIGADSLNSPTLQRLDNLYKFKQLRSNCPPVERHCVNRWLFLAEKKLFGQETIINLDWDTLVFTGISSHSKHLTGIDLAATNLMTLSWDGVPDEPIWSLCPNFLHLSSSALNLYTSYLDKYLAYSEKYGSIVKHFFCDMQPWSSVIASTLTGKSKLRLLNFNDIIESVGAIDHNVRILNDCGMKFQEMRYYFQQGTHTYLHTPYLPAKQIIFSKSSRPYFVVNETFRGDDLGAKERPPQLKEAAAIHFSGVEGKHLLMQTFLENIRSYLRIYLVDPNIVIP